MHDGELVGILTLNDLALSASGGRKAAVSFDAVGKTLATISQHRTQHRPGESTAA